MTKANDVNKEMIAAVVNAIGNFERAITPRGSGNTLIMGGKDETGGYVSSLTEAVMGVTAGLCKIAESIDRYTEAVDRYTEAVKEKENA